MRITELKERFLSKMGPPNKLGCREWTAAVRSNGYGVITICDKNSKYKYNSTQSAHRISYELFISDIPDGLCVLHKCDNRRCVNHEHLFLGTIKDNVDDMVKKDRCSMKRGQDHFGSKLKEADIKEIFTLSFHLSQRDIARKFNVAQCAIQNILHHKTWTHISNGMINMAPRDRRGNQRGANNGRSKLSLEQAVFILKNKGITSANELANKFKVSPGTIRNIWNYRTGYIGASNE